MQLMLRLTIPPLPDPITYTDTILLIGSCFTEHMAERLAGYKFKTLSNPNGILFSPLSVAESLNSYIDHKLYAPKDMFYLNETWNSWAHHSRFSHIDAGLALQGINQSQQEAGAIIKQADWIIITLGTAFQYYFAATGQPVANNHRAPAAWFTKRLLDIAEIEDALGTTIHKLQAVNANAKVLFTISPVRHIREGVIDNNRSKARLIDAVHNLCGNYSNAFYFPAYELLIDILRDYRYYDADFVHPNYLATSFVWEQFAAACIIPAAHGIMEAVLDISTARKHRPRFPETDAHKKFKADYAAKVDALIHQYPFLNLQEELSYFKA